MNKKILIAIVLFLVISHNSFSSIENSIFNVGLNAYNRGDYETAIKNLEIIFNEYPESPLFSKACMYLGYIYYDTGDIETAKRYLTISVRSSQKGSEVWKASMRLLGVIYYDEGDEIRYEKIFNEIRKYEQKLELNKPEENTIRKNPIKDRQTTIEKAPTTTLEKPTKPRSPKTEPTTITNYTTNIIYITNISEITNYITNIISSTVNIDIISSTKTNGISDVKNKVDEILKKEEDLEELNRLTDVKNRLLKLNEKVLLIQEALQRKIENKKGEE
ncbi:MAG: outer membrane protein assembly factor BamD [Brevinematales bacterium]|nr:outer membrane protein assembly factor BamD [Brevinematales bacterium]